MFSHLVESVAVKIRNSIVNDMNPHPLVVHAKLCGAVVAGGLFSLVICGQFGMGFTNWAEALSHQIHENMPPLLCSAICGTFFAIFPILFLRLVLCSPMQFRIILKRRITALSLWYGSTGIVLASYGQHGQGLSEILLWFISAIIASYTLAMIMKALIPAWSLTEYLNQKARAS